MNSVLLRPSLLAALGCILAVIPGCNLPEWPSITPARVMVEHVYLPHIEAIDLPATARVGEPVQCTIHVSAASNPALMSDTRLELHPYHTSNEYSQGVKEGSYHVGEFLGMAFVESGGSYPQRTAVTTSYIFNTPGTVYLYFGHIADAAQGGIQVEVEPFADQLYASYPVNPLIEIFEMQINILP